MHYLKYLASSFVLALVVAASVVAPVGAGAPPASEIAQWQAERAEEVTSDTGWLTLVGLYWLEEGRNSLGSDPKSRVRVGSPALARHAGVFVRKGDFVRFVATRGSGISHQGEPVTSIELVADTKGEPTVLESGSLSFILIERGGRYGIRARDRNNPARVNFHGLRYFPANADWAFDARFEPYPPGRTIPIINILGMEQAMPCPGALVFTSEGREYRLDAVLEEPDAKDLFVMFADRTSGRETYGAGRFLHASFPRDGRTLVDFNKSYNPPCAFSNFATCPLPPPQNRLDLRVEAGEKTYANEEHGG